MKKNVVYIFCFCVILFYLTYVFMITSYKEWYILTNVTVLKEITYSIDVNKLYPVKKSNATNRSSQHSTPSEESIEDYEAEIQSREESDSYGKVNNENELDTTNFEIITDDYINTVSSEVTESAELLIGIGTNKTIIESNKILLNDDLTSLPIMNDCPPYPPNLTGRIDVVEFPVPDLSDLESEYSWLKNGGSYSPPCRQNQTIAIIVPYRNRRMQLVLFLKHIHPFLKKQQLNYTIYVIEQNDGLPFNRGQLMNIGFVESLKQFNFSCFIFHDVDLLPEDDRIIYNCADQPLHLISALDKWEYKLLYEDLFGGAVAINTMTYKVLNGFSNRFWGWGGEDDDLKKRLDYYNFTFLRYPEEIGRYTMLKHFSEEPNPVKQILLSNASLYFYEDGLSSLYYTVKSIEKYLLYTRVSVELKENEIF